MFGMGKKSKVGPDGEPIAEKPLPDPTLLKRPGTSGTEYVIPITLSPSCTVHEGSSPPWHPLLRLSLLQLQVSLY